MARTSGSGSRSRQKPEGRGTGPAPRKVGYAVVGLGYIAQVAVMPAFAHARRNSRLVAFVSGDRVKKGTLGRRYGVEHVYGYEDYADGRDPIHRQ